MKIELVRNDEIGQETVEPKKLAESIYLTTDSTIFILGEMAALKITRSN
jgi:hypothetical protein